MLLQNLLEKDPAEAFIHLERRMNNETHHADVAEEYSAHGRYDTFELPFCLLDFDEVRYFESNPEKRMRDKILDNGKVKFFVHPEMILEFKRKNLKRLLVKDGIIEVSPTSSTRTVFCRAENFMIKTDLEKKIGDGVKKLKSPHIIHIMKIGRELKEYLPENFAYMPEPIGASYSSGNREVGLLIRQFEVEPKIEGRRYLIPFFSLFSDDLLHQITSHGKSIDVCIEKIIKPYLDSWANLLLQRGLRAEMHAQNTLLEIDGQGKPSRIVYRDLQDVFVDPDIRKSLGFKRDFKKNVVGQNDRAYLIGNERVEDPKKCSQISHSLTYDYRIGRALDYFSSVFPGSEEQFRDAVKGLWKHHFNGTEIFPNMAYHLAPNQKNISGELVFEEIKPKYR